MKAQIFTVTLQTPMGEEKTITLYALNRKELKGIISAEYPRHKIVKIN
jgi:hypothetical protein